MQKANGVVVMGLSLLFIVCAGTGRLKRVKETAVPAIIPKPAQMAMQAGVFAYSKDTRIFTESHAELQLLADGFSAWLQRSAGWRPVVEPAGSAAMNGVRLLLDAQLQRLGPEGYRLKIAPDGIVIASMAPQGIFYGLQTLKQLFPAAWEGAQRDAPAAVQLPCLEIEDQPRYAWRGMMLDVARHFQPKEVVLRFIDHLAALKMNTFHWHLTDDQGWRIEIKKYPRLTEVGAWRVDRSGQHWSKRPPQQPDEIPNYGGYYTQAEIREVVAYARERFITIVPEIEMPAHAMAALAAYPQYSCTGGPFTVPTGSVWPISQIYCGGNDSTFLFLEDVLDEVIDLFPGIFIHVGGDEADKGEWKKCQKCQARIRQEGLKDEAELQSFFIKRMERFLSSRNRRLIGWDEILEGGLAHQATVMSWRGMEGGIQAAQSGHDVVMSPTSHCYFDYYQGSADTEPLAIGGYVPLEKVYEFEPTPEELNAEQSRHILGAQANLWTEFITTPQHAEYMLFPRLLALAEVVWSPKEARQWDDFIVRVFSWLPRLDAAGIHYARSIFKISAAVTSEPGRSGITVQLGTPVPEAQIHYTLDGTEPHPGSPRFDKPLYIKKTSDLKAVLYHNGERMGTVLNQTFLIHQASGKKIELMQRPSRRYAGRGPFTLIDGLHGSLSHVDGHWLGFEASDMEAVIDLGKPLSIRGVKTTFLENRDSWIFLPLTVEYAFSEDGRVFAHLSSLTNGAVGESGSARVEAFAQAFPDLRARYVKVKATNRGVCPPDHPGAGGKAWIFVDEIVVE